MSLVLDASATAARFHPQEQTRAILDVFDMVSYYGAWVPSLWHLEIANIFRTKIRRKEYNSATRDRYFVSLRQLSIETDEETSGRAWTETLAISDRHDLTIYDAAYLELALRLALPLATLDKELRTAADAAGVQLLGL